MLSHHLKLRAGLVLLAGCMVTLAQGPKADPGTQPGLEFPASLQSKIVAGSTPAGTEVRARLAMATLMDGVVLPQDAVISGHVEQSVAKTDGAPSLLKIKFDSARWKKGSAPVNLYLAGCYYPIDFKGPTDGPSGMHGEIGVMMGSTPPDALPRANSGMPNNGGMPTMDTGRPGTYPDPRPGVTLSEVSKHWVRMEKVETVAAPDGGLQITSRDRNLKLDKGTVYLLRTAPPPAAK
jgi:hypothetical protein